MDLQDFEIASLVMDQVRAGEDWTGQILVKNKTGERFLAASTNTPLYDDNNSLVGIVCASNEARPSQETMPHSGQLETEPSLSRLRSTSATKLGLDYEQPLQVAFASKISNLVSSL